MKTICIIPARCGSKRIKNKNIKDFLGKPIIYYSIKIAIESKCFDEVMVSTDDIEIKNIAEKYGANVPFMRSEKNSDDNATIKDVLIEVLHQYKKKNINFDYMCCIFPTAPLIKLENLLLGFEKIKDFEYVFAVTPFSFPVQRSLIIDNNSAIFKYPEYINTRSQDLTSHYQDSGQFYWSNTKRLLETQQIYSKNNFSIILSELETQDIDNESDWKIAEMKYKLIM